jgi:hypothetical protein
MGVGLSVQKALGRKLDFMAACHRLVLEVFSTSWDGAFNDGDANKGRTGSLLTLTAVVEHSGGVRFIEQALELPPSCHRNFAGLSGSHLPKGHLLYGTTGCNYPCDEATVALARNIMRERRSAAERALRELVRGASTATVGAREIGAADELLSDDALYFREWRHHAGVYLTLVPAGELRQGFVRATKAKLAVPKPHWPMLKKLTPQTVERLAPEGVRHPAAAAAAAAAAAELPPTSCPTVGEASGVPKLSKRKLGGSSAAEPATGSRVEDTGRQLRSRGEVELGRL